MGAVAAPVIRENAIVDAEFDALRTTKTFAFKLYTDLFNDHFDWFRPIQEPMHGVIIPATESQCEKADDGACKWDLADQKVADLMGAWSFVSHAATIKKGGPAGHPCR